MGGRNAVAIALLAAALWVMTTACPAVAADGASVTTVPGAPSYGALVPGPDGLLWHAETAAGGPPATRIVRVGAGGVGVTTVPDVTPFWGAEPRLLLDGAMGLVVRYFDEVIDGWDLDGLALLRLASDSGAVASVRRLPDTVSRAVSAAVAPDGAVWFALCNNGLARLAPDGRLTSVPLPSLRCNPDSNDVRPGLEFAFDPTGAVWFANFCAGRMARVSPSGRARKWDVVRAGCGFYSVSTMLAADPLGGVFYAASGGESDGSGRIHDGRVVRFSSYGAGAFTSDGALWRVFRGGIERRDAGGSTTVFRAPDALRALSDPVPARGGGVAVVRANYWRTDPNYDPHNPPANAHLDGHVAILRPDGSQTRWSLPDRGTDAPTQLSHAALALGPDGAFYVRETRVAESYLDLSSRLLRVLPDGLVPPRTPVARVSTVLGRVGRVAWLQLACDAELAHFCLGTVRLTGRGVSRAPAQFALAGSSRGAVRVALDDRGLRLLQRDGALRTTVVVRTDGGLVTRQPVRIDSVRPR